MDAALASRVTKDAGGPEIADALVALWRDIEGVLQPIIGSQGVVALYRRSLHLAQVSCPALVGLSNGTARTLELDVLRAVIAVQPPEYAAEVAGVLLQTFRDLLENLVGPSLTMRLLSSVGAHVASGASAQDPPK